MSFQEVFVGDECIKLATPFKRDREWFREFVRWPTTAIHKYILYYYILYLSTKTSSLVVRVYLPVQ